MKKAMAALILFLIETLLFYLYEMPLEAWAYSSVFILLIFGGWIILDEVQQRKKYKQLKNIQKEAEVYLETEHFGKPENAVEKEYQNLAEMLGRQWENARQEARCQISEANRYYIRWSHQIKTPIAGLQLLLQMERSELEEAESKDEITEAAKKVLEDGECGKVFRVKGFLKDKEEKWLELNATHQEIRTAPIPEGQEVVIVIGEEMNEAKIRGYFS